MPVCLWECFECFQQFFLVANDPPKVCPHCLKGGAVHFVDNIESTEWRPKYEEEE
jgi:hypothetical protein